MSRDPLSAPPIDDADIAAWIAALGLDCLIDLHVHFLPDQVMAKVWAYFDGAAEHFGTPLAGALPPAQQDRLAVLRALGVRVFAPLVYPHKPGVAEWLNGWVADFAAAVDAAVPTATLYPEPGVAQYLERALAGGARCVKVHVQVGAFDPRDPVLDPAWGLLAEAGVPVVVHCGHGPMAGRYTGLDVFGAVLAAHPRSVRLVDVADRVVLGTDFRTSPTTTPPSSAPSRAGRPPMTGWVPVSCVRCCATRLPGCWVDEQWSSWRYPV